MRLRGLLLGCLMSTAGLAHDLGMNRVEVRETGPESVVVDAWFDPERLILATPPEVPENWEAAGDPEVIPDRPKQRVRFRYTRSGDDPDGAVLKLDWERQALAVRTRNRVGESASFLLRREDGPFVIEVGRIREPVPQRAGPEFVGIGMEHIYFGWDHLLFVLMLTLLLGWTWKLPAALSGFTLAHSASLFAGIAGVVSVPGTWVEPLIAFSIVTLACEGIRQGRGLESMTSRHPWLLSVAFGVIHGLGFAGAFGELQIPPGQLLPAVLWFTLGIEIGQVTLVLAGLALGAMATRLTRAPVPGRACLALRYATGLLAATWLWQRVGGAFLT